MSRPSADKRPVHTLVYKIMFALSNVKLDGSSYMVSAIRDNPLALRQFYWAFICENGFPTSRVKDDPAWSFTALIEQSNLEIFHFLWVSLGHSITVGFAKLIFTSLIQISALNPGISWHSPCRQFRRPFRRAKVFIWRKVVPPARVTLLAEVRQPSFLARRDNSGHSYKRLGVGMGGLSRVAETI